MARVNRLVLVFAVVATLASAAFLGRMWFSGTTAVAAGPVARLDGFTVEVRDTEWAPMDHVDDGRGGFVMPSSMMPGAPDTGQVRIGVRIVLQNTRGSVQEFSLPEEFTLAGGLETEPLHPVADTVGPLYRLGPGASLNAVLYYDVRAPADGELPPLYLNWTRGRDTVRIPLPLPDAEAPEPHH